MSKWDAFTKFCLQNYATLKDYISRYLKPTIIRTLCNMYISENFHQQLFKNSSVAVDCGLWTHDTNSFDWAENVNSKLSKSISHI